MDLLWYRSSHCHLFHMRGCVQWTSEVIPENWPTWASCVTLLPDGCLILALGMNSSMSSFVGLLVLERHK